jgi:spermidine/putrescine transport system permease protein
MSIAASLGGGAGSEVAPPVEERRGRRRFTPYLLLLPAAGWLILFFVVPMFTLASTSLKESSDPSAPVAWKWTNYTHALSEYKDQFIRSFGFAATATVLALLIAYPLAYAIAFKARRWRALLLVLVIAPFFTSFLIRTLAWKTILSDHGWVVSVLDKLYILNITDWLNLTEGGRILATPLAVILGLTYNFLPFMTLPLYASLEKIDHRLIEAAGDLYSSAWTSFRKVTWPLSLPGVVAGTLLTFIPAAGDYINVKLLGTTSQTMAGNVIDAQFLRVRDYPTAASLSFSLMIAIVVLVALYVRRAGTEELV